MKHTKLSVCKGDLPNSQVKNNILCGYLETNYHHNYSNLNQENLLTDFANINSSYLNDNSLGVNAKFNVFLSCLDVVANAHAPLKKLTKNEIKFRNKPWINRKIEKMLGIRDEVLNRLQNSNDSSLRYL